jgi:hypothetical protein
MVDQASLKLLLRPRFELIATMLLIGERIRKKPALSVAPVLPAARRRGRPCWNALLRRRQVPTGAGALQNANSLVDPLALGEQQFKDLGCTYRGRQYQT